MCMQNQQFVGIADTGMAAHPRINEVVDDSAQREMLFRHGGAGIEQHHTLATEEEKQKGAS